MSNEPKHKTLLIEQGCFRVVGKYEEDTVRLVEQSLWSYEWSDKPEPGLWLDFKQARAVRDWLNSLDLEDRVPRKVP